MNPLVDARKNIKIMEDFNIKISEDIEKFRKIKHSIVVQPGIDIESLLVLSSQTKNSGSLKKVLHVPTFCVYFLEEQPIQEGHDAHMLE